MVVDASAVVAWPKGGPKASAVRKAIEEATHLVMPSVTLTEALLIALKEGRSASETKEWVAELRIDVVPVDATLAFLAAKARHRYPIRFGDAFVYALAKERGLPILTLDAEFAKTDAALVPIV